MRPTEFIATKRDKKEHTEEQLRQWFQWIKEDTVDPEQISAWLMAVYLHGMTKEEIDVMTDCMVHSGDVLDTSAINNTVVDKHSTGGVGDTTTLVMGPIVAALGIPVAKMSGRGLGHTGGTLDKLSAIPGLRVDLSEEEFIKQVNDISLAVTGQTGELVPTDGKLYALRDVTATVDSIPLIASSIMSKKLAVGADKIVLDVKIGSGAFMKTVDKARELAIKMAEIGQSFDKETVCYITDMETPLGDYIGNALEVYEAIQILKGEKKGPLLEVSLQLAAEEILLSDQAKNIDDAKAHAQEMIDTGKGLDALRAMIEAQKGDTSVIDDPDQLLQRPLALTITADNDGVVTRFDAMKTGEAALAIDCGRRKKGDDLDLYAGIIRKKRIGDAVTKGDVIVEIYTEDQEKAQEALEKLQEAISIGSSVEERPLIHDRITAETSKS